MIVSRLPAAAAMCGSISIGTAAASSTLPAWFETMMPSTPQAAAFTASPGCRMPLTISGRGQRSRSRFRKSQSSVSLRLMKPATLPAV